MDKHWLPKLDEEYLDENINMMGSFGHRECVASDFPLINHIFN